MSKKLEKLLKFREDDKTAIYEEIADLNEHLSEVTKIFDKIDPEKLNALTGEKGKDGKTPVRGMDYMTPEEVQDFLDKATPKKGEHYFNDEEVEEFLSRSTPQKDVHYFDGMNGADGKDGITTTVIEEKVLSAEDIASKINTLEGAIEAKTIKGIKSAKDIFSEYASLPKKEKQSWSTLFREDGNPFSYNQVAGAGSPATLPAMGGEAGKFLYTDGAVASWQTISGSVAIGGTVTGGTNNALLYINPAGTLSEITAGTNGDVLTMVAGVPTYQTPTSGVSTLAGVGTASTTAPNSIYTMTNNIDVVFESAGGTDIVTIDEANERLTALVLNIPTTTATVGQIMQEGMTILHTWNGSASLDRLNLWMLGSGNFTSTGNKNIGISGKNTGAFGPGFSFITTGTSNVGIGAASLYAITEGSSNLAIGTLALAGITTGANNVGIGASAGRGITTGDSNLCIGGATAGTTGEDSSNNIVIGNDAWEPGSGTITNCDYNITIGASADNVSRTGANYNIGIGYTAIASVGGSDNIAIGYSTQSATTGSKNIAIGYEIDIQSLTSSNQLTIGNLIFGTGLDGTGTTVSTGKIGIGVVPTLAKLEVAGSLLNQRLIEANTAGSGSPNIITASESYTIYTNEGSAAQNYHTLPTAVAGLTYTFYVEDADGIRVTASAGDTIRISASVSAVAGYTESTTIGSTVTLVAINATEWIAISSLGTWTLV